ncbi:MAG: radical SAM family heme chaperone HemW [Proteobacteria bacterium]|nr:radical SAM family heme chaperone HemW [Pseudomonadota bacterium]
MSMPPLALYVHLPWCVRKCPYCDFNSHTAGTDAPRARYIAALLADFDVEAGRAAGRPLTSIFLGGGTPSLFPPADIDQLLSGIRARFELGADLEITMEANPGTVECGDPEGYRAAGINRLSIGAQSFDAVMLTKLGRIHSVDDTARAVDAARTAGFANLNIDLMFGLPGQDIDGAMADLRAAFALRPSHLSWYQLTLEPNTVFHSRPPPHMPSDDLSADIQAAGQALLIEHGFEQYEVSAYARNGQTCRHNLNYWSFGDYLAAGAGAHGKITDSAGIWRYAKKANPLGYMQALESGEAVAVLSALDERELVFEFMLNALRLTHGFELGLFTSRTGLPAEVLSERLLAVSNRGLMEEPVSGFWRASGLGLRFLNDLQAEFLP